MFNPISAVLGSKPIQAVTDALGVTESSDKREETKESSGESGDFETLLRGILSPDAGNKVNEEALFAALSMERISELKGDEAAEHYRELLDKHKTAVRRGDGYVNEEEATIRALKEMVADGTLTAEEGDKVYSEAFAGAQLDDNKDALFDGRGSENDPTIAIAEMESALINARSMVDRLASGEEAAPLRSLANAGSTGGGAAAAGSGVNIIEGVAGTYSPGDETIEPDGTTVDGSEGFLFKPITDNDGVLGVLLPATMTGHIMSVILKDNDGKVIEEGVQKNKGDHDTGREKWIFNKKGENYPRDLIVETTLADGSVKRYKIADPSQRYD